MMANLACELTLRNVHVTVLTARWHPGWPDEIRFRDVPVVRLARPPGRGRDTNRYMKSLARWLRGNRQRYELVCVSGLRHEAYTAVKTVGKQVPVVLRAEAAGRFGDCLWQLDAGGGRRIKQECMKADALIGPSKAIERELVAAGYPRDRVHYLPNGVPIPPACDPACQSAARAAVIDGNPALQMTEEAPLAVSIARLHPSKGLGYLVAAWQRVIAARPDARLWLVGEGPHRAKLENQIVDLDLLGRVFLAGVFDSVAELLAAADVFALPSREEGPSLALVEAMAARLPVVTTDIPGNREVVTGGEHGLLVPPCDVDAIGGAVLRLLDGSPLGARLGAAARERARRQFSLAQTADAHLALFESLTRAHPVQACR
jgi:glycosyltransferase involved in cell wall biosynthesis